MSIAIAIGLTGLASLAVGLLLLPLLARRSAPPSREAYNRAVYRDQLAEIERDLGRGLLNPEQAAAARAEIGRRVLALDDAAAAPPPVGTRPLIATIVAILAMPVLALLIYAGLGAPGLPDQASAGGATGAAATAEEAAPQMSMREALARLRAHLEAKPDDLTGWLLLARSEVGLGRYKEGAEAYGRAAALAPDRPDIAADWGEAQVLAAGAVTPEAARAFETGLRDPASTPKSRYYLALAKLEQGDRRGALHDWAALANDSPPEAEWQPMLRRRIAEVAREAGIDPATLLRSAAAAPADGMPPPETVAAAAKAAEGAAPEERRAMIETMVARLAARLEQQPDDAEGWARLGRSYLVLDEPVTARDAYAHATRLKPDDTALAAALAEATRRAAAAATGDGSQPPR
jgi:cytochrome c-type biogenesis protein CcmH